MRILLAMLGAAVVFPLVGIVAGFVGALIIREAAYVGYQLAPTAAEAVYATGQIAMVLNMVHAVVWAALAARRVFNAIAAA